MRDVATPPLVSDVGSQYREVDRLLKLVLSEERELPGSNEYSCKLKVLDSDERKDTPDQEYYFEVYCKRDGRGKSQSRSECPDETSSVDPWPVDYSRHLYKKLPKEQQQQYDSEVSKFVHLGFWKRIQEEEARLTKFDEVAVAFPVCRSESATMPARPVIDLRKANSERPIASLVQWGLNDIAQCIRMRHKPGQMVMFCDLSKAFQRVRTPLRVLIRSCGKFFESSRMSFGTSYGPSGLRYVAQTMFWVVREILRGTTPKKFVNERQLCKLESSYLWKDVSLMSFYDDFCIVGSRLHVERVFRILRLVASRLGFEFPNSKVERIVDGDNEWHKALGLFWNITNGSLRSKCKVPKIEEIPRVTSKRQLYAAAGQIYNPLRTHGESSLVSDFIRSWCGSLRDWKQRIRLNKSQCDLLNQRIAYAVKELSNDSVRAHDSLGTRRTLVIMCDAAKSGFGYVILGVRGWKQKENGEIQLEDEVVLEENATKWKDAERKFHCNRLEMKAAVASLARAAKLLSLVPDETKEGMKIVLATDSKSCVRWLKYNQPVTLKGIAKSAIEAAQASVHEIFEIWDSKGVSAEVIHVPGEHNSKADRLSRLMDTLKWPQPLVELQTESKMSDEDCESRSELSKLTKSRPKSSEGRIGYGSSDNRWNLPKVKLKDVPSRVKEQLDNAYTEGYEVYQLPDTEAGDTRWCARQGELPEECQVIPGEKGTSGPYWLYRQHSDADIDFLAQKLKTHRGAFSADTTTYGDSVLGCGTYCYQYAEFNGMRPWLTVLESRQVVTRGKNKRAPKQGDKRNCHPGKTKAKFLICPKDYRVHFRGTPDAGTKLHQEHLQVCMNEGWEKGMLWHARNHRRIFHEWQPSLAEFIRFYWPLGEEVARKAYEVFTATTAVTTVSKDTSLNLRLTVSEFEKKLTTLLEECNDYLGKKDHRVRVRDMYKFLKDSTAINDSSLRQKIEKLLETGLYTIYRDHLYIRFAKKFAKYIPQSAREWVKWRIHASLGSTHLAAYQAYQKCRRKFYWPSMYQDFVEYTKSCPICQEFKAQRRCVKPYRLPRIAKGRFKRIQMDLLDLGGNFEPQERYWWTFSDEMTGLCHAVLAERKDSEDAFKAVVSWLSGKPLMETLQVDNGPAFRSERFRRLCDQFGINLNFGLAYSPQNQGRVERLHQDIKLSLKMRPKNLPVKQSVQIAVAARNALPNSRTGFSPFDLAFGLMYDSKLLSRGRTYVPDEDAEELVNHLDKLVTIMQSRAEENRIEEILDRLDSIETTNRKDRNFKKGEPVWYCRYPGNRCTKHEIGAQVRIGSKIYYKLVRPPVIQLAGTHQLATRPNGSGKFVQMQKYLDKLLEEEK